MPSSILHHITIRECIETLSSFIHLAVGISRDYACNPYESYAKYDHAVSRHLVSMDLHIAALSGAFDSLSEYRNHHHAHLSK